MSNSKSASHIGPIIFSNEIARSQLEEHGEVVTFRKSPRTTGDTWWRKSRLGPKQGDVVVSPITEVDPMNKEVLSEYRSLSGFPSVEDWQHAIRSLNGLMPSTGYLYRVIQTS